LNVLEFSQAQQFQEIDLKIIREQYLKLAQKYHPDVSTESANGADTSENEERFIKVKDSFDRLVFLDKDSRGQLFQSAEHLRKAAQSEQEKQMRMSNLKQRIKLQKQREVDLRRRQEEAAEK